MQNLNWSITSIKYYSCSPIEKQSVLSISESEWIGTSVNCIIGTVFSSNGWLPNLVEINEPDGDEKTVHF